MSAATSAPIQVALDAPIDALAAGMIAIASPEGARTAGRSELHAGEVLWTFIPEASWQAGQYRIMVLPRLEDSAGNTIGEPLAHAGEAVSGPPRQAIEIPFSIQ
jgi:hypothetical protein